MALSLFDDDDVEEVLNVLPQKDENGVPESPQKMLSRGKKGAEPKAKTSTKSESMDKGTPVAMVEIMNQAKTKWPSGQRIVVETGDLKGETGAIKDIVIHASENVFDDAKTTQVMLVMDWDREDLKTRLVAAADVRYAGASDATKEASLRKLQLQPQPQETPPAEAPPPVVELPKKTSRKKKAVPAAEAPELPTMVVRPIGTFVRRCGSPASSPVGVVVSGPRNEIFNGSTAKLTVVTVLWIAPNPRPNEILDGTIGSLLSTEAVSALEVQPEESFFWRELASAILELEETNLLDEVNLDDINEETKESIIGTWTEEVQPEVEVEPEVEPEVEIEVEPEVEVEPELTTAEPTPVPPPVPQKEVPAVLPVSRNEIDELVTRLFLGLTDNAQVTKVIGLPIDFSFTEFERILRDLRDMIGLPIAHDSRIQAAKVQEDQYWIHKVASALEWAADQAQTEFENWESYQISSNYEEARRQYEEDVRGYKSKKNERPIAPSESMIKYQVRGSKAWLAYKSAAAKYGYWASFIKKCAVDGHARKAFLVMNLSKLNQGPGDNLNPERSLDESMTPETGSYDQISVEDPMVDAEAFAGPKNEDYQERPPEQRPQDQSPEAPKSTLDPVLLEEYPWLAETLAAEGLCAQCMAKVYIPSSGDGVFSIDQTPHRCQGEAESEIEDGFVDIDVGDIFNPEEKEVLGTDSDPDQEPSTHSAAQRVTNVATAAEEDDFLKDLEI